MTKIYSSAIIVLLCCANKLTAQTVNTGELVVMPYTQFSTLSNFDNTAEGDMINDGNFLVYADFNNDGLITFSPELHSGMTHFKGLFGAQKIAGLSPSELYNVKFENSPIQPAFLLSGKIKVFGNSDFTEGVVENYLNKGTFIFQEKATHRNTKDRSHVNGPVKKIGDRDFEFPIGSEEYYRPALTAGSQSVTDTYTSTYFLKNSDTLYPHKDKDVLIKQINDKEYWRIDKDKGDSDIILSLTVDTKTTPDFIYDKVADTEIQIVRWDSIARIWKLEGGLMDESQTMVTSKVSGYGIFTLARVVKNAPSNDIVVYNALSPNGDGVNDFFFIQGINKFPENTMQIYNRWGVLVYEQNGYNENDKVFKGYSEGRATMSKNEGLPTGTYFYVLKYKDGNNSREKTGYLYINR